jgi:tRNA(fMet)-specific endonuclease VapC
MIRYLLDTNHISYYFKASSPLMARVEHTSDADFGISTSTLAELWFMVHKSQRLAQNTSRLRELLNEYRHWPFDENAAEIFGQLKAQLRRTGRNVADIDLQIASVALTNNLVVLTADTAFANVPGLSHENWLV